MRERKRTSHVRFIALMLIPVAAFLAYTVRLADMQMVNQEKWSAGLNPENRSTAIVTAARGEILDRYGRPLAVNREGYHLILDGAYLERGKINATLKSLVEMLKKTGEPWRDILPLSAEAPYAFSEAADGAKAAAMKRRLELNTYATAENCYDAMVKRYKLTNYTKEYQRILMGVRYTMETEDYNVASRYVFAEDISFDTALRLRETPDPLAGVDVDVVPIREYAAPDIAPHLLGEVGPFQAEDWKNNNKKYLADGYRMNDYKGNSGMELAAEKYLRGVNGKKRITQDSAGRVTDVEVLQEPVAGNTVSLTLDSRLQKAVQDALANRNKAMKQKNPGDGSLGAAAAVVMDINSGEILAAANYPTYNMTDYKKNYEALSTDKVNRPLFNRAFDGGYPTGSTFKPATALIGLQTGKITATSTVRCTGSMMYLDHRFICYNRSSHGTVNVIKALSKSCNIFFFDTARQVGIDNLNRYCRLFGLGVPTGVEVGEYDGILAGPEYRASVKQVWHPGDTLQAAIGQAENSLTMLQMAVYTSTIANNGSRYKAHLLKEVRTYGLEESVYTYVPEVLNKTGIDEAHYKTVKQGMLSVTEDGTAQGVFANYPIHVGGKTGTAENSTGVDHSVFIAFAPYEKPEIAVAIILEKAAKGFTAAQIGKDVLDAYFFPEIESCAAKPAGELLQ